MIIAQSSFIAQFLPVVSPEFINSLPQWLQPLAQFYTDYQEIFFYAALGIVALIVLFVIVGLFRTPTVVKRQAIIPHGFKKYVALFDTVAATRGYRIIPQLSLSSTSIPHLNMRRSARRRVQALLTRTQIDFLFCNAFWETKAVVLLRLNETKQQQNRVQFIKDVMEDCQIPLIEIFPAQVYTPDSIIKTIAEAESKYGIEHKPSTEAAPKPQTSVDKASETLKPKVSSP